MKIIGIAVRNLRRRVVRTLVLLLAVSVVTGALFGAAVFISSMENALRIGTYRLGADVLVVPESYESQARSALLAGEPTSFQMDKAVLDKVKKVEGVKAASVQLFVKPSSFTCCYNVDVFLVGFDPSTDFTIKPWLERHLDRGLAIDEVIVGREMPVVAGDSIPFFGSSFRVAGTMEPTGMKFFDRSVFMTMEAAYQMAEHSKERAMEALDVKRDRISTVLVRIADNVDPERVAIRIEHDVEGVKAIASDQIISTVRKQLKGLLRGIIVIGGFLWCVILVLIGFTFYMLVNERQREIGLLRAMGAKKSKVFLMIIYEATIISLIGGVLGTAGAGLLLGVFKGLIMHWMKMPYLVPHASVLASYVVSAIAVAFLTGLFASLIPATVASRMQPFDAIRKGE